MVATERRTPWRAPRVLMYHFFGEAPGSGDPEGMFVRVEDLVAHVRALHRAGWEPMDLDEYLAALAGPDRRGRRYLLTIDDAHVSVAEAAAPVLAALGVPSVLFVPTALVGEHAVWDPEYADQPLATASTLRTLPGLGMELGVHGADHTRMLGLPGAELRRQVDDARDGLRELTGTRPRAFAYPYGTHDDDARRAVADAGFDVAFAVAREHGRHAVDRIGIYRGDTARRVLLKTSSGFRVASRVAGRLHKPRHAVRDGVQAMRARRSRTVTSVPSSVRRDGPGPG